MLSRLFGIKEAGSAIRREIAAGVTTFLTMAYIIFVNPGILSDAGMDKDALITATILASAFGTLLVGLWANVPFAMAPGMGLNAAFVFMLVLGKEVTWETALGVVFLSGVFFLLLTLFGIRARIVRAIPMHLRLAIAAGIGLFITFIGFQKLGLVTAHPATMVHMTDKFSASLCLGLAGLGLTVILEVRKVKGSILTGILLTTLLALFFVEDVALPERILSAPPSIAPVFMRIDLFSALKWSMWGSIFSFMFVDLFDSVGTIVACSYEAGLVEEDGSIRKIDRLLGSDAVATIAGSLLGTSTTTTYIESGAGIAQGGRTGFAAVVTAVLFLAALPLTPLIGIVPAFATAPALIVVGIYMFKNVLKIDLANLESAVPAFFTIVLMPLTYSISTGIGFGFVSYALVMAASGKARKVHPVMWTIAMLAAADLVLSFS